MMIKYLVVLIALLFCSSCITIEDAHLCSVAPPAPVVANNNIQLSPNAALNVSVISPSTALTYFWVSPNRSVLQGSSLYYPYSDRYGEWSLVAQKNSTCTSDTTKVNVNMVATDCGIGRDTFLIGSMPADLVHLTGSTFNPSYPYYRLTYSDAVGSVVYLYFSHVPTTSGVYNATNTNYAYLYSNQCVISYNGYTTYAGYI